MKNDCKVRKLNYSTMSQYTKNTSKDMQLGRKYMRLSREALEEDDEEIKARRLNLERMLKGLPYLEIN